MLALTLVGASLLKLRRAGRVELADALMRYGLIPRALITPATLVLPWIELLLAMLLGLGVALVPAAGFAAVLLAAFALVVAWQVARGRRFACGCGSGGNVSWALASRDLVLALMSGCVAVGPSGALSLGPGPVSAPASVSAGAMLPVPLIVVLALVSIRLLARLRAFYAAYPTVARPSRAG